MKTFLVIPAAFLALLAARAEAIEMFTNFDNGQNIGLPSNDVPVAIYGGVGTRGWNTHALRYTPIQSGTPALFPTGANPHLYQNAAPGRGYTTNRHGYGNKYYGQKYQGRIYGGQGRSFGGRPVFGETTVVENDNGLPANMRPLPGHASPTRGAVVEPELLPKMPLIAVPGEAPIAEPLIEEVDPAVDLPLIESPENGSPALEIPTEGPNANDRPAAAALVPRHTLSRQDAAAM